MTRFALAAWVAAATFALCAPSAYPRTEDVGEVAVIEDLDGSILAFPGASMPNVFLGNVACAFYRTHEDNYDGLFIFNTSVTNIQQGWSWQNTNEGIGRPLFDWTQQACSATGRLRITVNMGNINTLPSNPDLNAPIVPFYPLTGIELQAHEFGHHWLSAVNFDKNDGQGMQCLLRGYEPTGGDGSAGGDTCNGYGSNGFNQHWSYYFNSCSLMYGSCIEDLGGGNFRFSYPLGTVKYSQLDQYLMGLRTAEEVEPMFVVDVGDVQGSASIPMGHGSSGEETGTRVDVAIEDIVRQEGPRNPALDVCHWKAAFILVHPQGQPPAPQQVQAVDNYRARWESFYDWSTDNRGSFDTTLDGCGIGTAGCPGEPEPGCGAGPECTNGEQRCLGFAVAQICRDERWRILEECSLDMICVDGSCEPAAADGDAPDGDAPTDGDAPADGDLPADGDAPADGDVADGDAPADGDSPADGDVPGDGDMPDGTLCAPGEAACEGDILNSCNSAGSGWISLDCASQGLSCDAAKGCAKGASSGCSAVGGSTALLMAAFVGLLALGRQKRKRAGG
ncbi:MAG: hypothetical protein C4523_12515 [Myxococcales bacterium]|nr:MAG: hypothetical protein C4523_12515 [Myxococcales bacterium]